MFSHALELDMHAENACANHMARDLCVISQNLSLQESGRQTSKITVETYKEMDPQILDQDHAWNLF